MSSTAGQVLGVKRVGGFHVVSLVAPAVAEGFRPGNLVAVTVGGPLTERLMRRTLPIHNARAAGAHGGTVEVVLHLAGRPADPGLDWLVRAPAGTPLDVHGPLGRPFALPKEPVTCVLVGEGAAGAPLFPLAERLKERGCTVHMLLGGATDGLVFGALEARRSARGLTVTTEDGSVGIHGTVADALPELLERTGAEVVYACAGPATLHAVAAAAEHHGAWSQTLLEVPMPCATGLCQACVVPVVGEDGLTRMVRACSEGPVFRGDRVRWTDLDDVPEGAR
ncbi:hypothetical protein [Nocardioides mesophilus]|uniref:iron-sulfur cluster-binding protein n=1 Tax=Nocardioides mesophilus TaxID=433659 RepID=UPI001CB6DD47|nr:hypothetical protein [Nocardioides mesophilus]